MVPIKGFEQYSIDESGRIFNSKGHQMATHIDRHGYESINFTIRPNYYHRFIHRMLAIAFIPNPGNKATVNHKNGIRADNRLENLEWCTQQENVLHGFRSNGRIVLGAKGESNKFSKFKSNQVIEIRDKYSSGSHTFSELAKEYGMSYFNARRIATSRTWKHI